MTTVAAPISPISPISPTSPHRAGRGPIRVSPPDPIRPAGLRRMVATAQATLIIVAFLVVTGVTTGRTVVELADGAKPSPADGLTVASLVAATMLAVQVVRRPRPLRPVPLVPTAVQGGLRRLVELSIFGTGSARTWTATDPGIGFDRLVRPAPEPIPVGGGRVGRDPGGEGSHPERQLPTSGGQTPWKAGSSGRHRGGDHEVAPGRSSADPGAAPGRPSGDVVTLRAGRTVTHVVARGETWWSLAERFLGDGRRWAALVELNRGRAAAPGEVIGGATPLRRGWTIAVPQPEQNE